MFVASYLSIAFLLISSTHAQNGITVGAFKDQQCSNPYAINYVNDPDPSIKLNSTQFDNCQLGAGAYGKISKLDKAVTMTEFPNLNGKARLILGLWKTPGCMGNPTVLSVYYEDSNLLKVKCTADKLTVVNEGKESVETGSGICKQSGNGMVGMFKCLIPESDGSLDATPGGWVGMLSAGLATLFML